MTKKKNDIKSKFNMFLNMNILADVLLLIFGVFLVFDPDQSAKTIGMIIGFLLVFYAATIIYTYISRNGARLYSMNIVFGTLIALLGIVLIVWPYTLFSFITTCLGLYLIVAGAIKINYAFWLKKGEEETWIITLVTGLMLVIVSCILMFSNFITLTLIQILGVFLICSTVLNLMDTVLFKKRSKEIVKIFW